MSLMVSGTEIEPVPIRQLRFAQGSALRARDFKLKRFGGV